MKVLMALIVAQAIAEPVWHTSHTPEERRLGQISLTRSHTNSADANCIVGGYDTTNPARVYVGGPCSEMNGTTGPKAGFRYVVMETIDMDISDKSHKNTTQMVTLGKKLQFRENVANKYSSVGVGISFHNKDGNDKRACMYASITSYLAKGQFSFNTNDFAIDKAADNTISKIKGVCVVPCPGNKCTGGTCPATKIAVTKGQYKYSIFVAAYDDSTGTEAALGAKYVPGDAGNGWKRKVKENGKPLAGYLNTYQGIDFTHMKADTLTMTAPDGTSKKYADMKACTRANLHAQSGCDLLAVKSVTVASANWTGTYSFPQTFGFGEYTMANKVPSPKAQGTRTVKIHLFKPSDSMKTLLKIPAASKVVFLRYAFDISGVTADAKKGKYFVYDPTVQTGKSASGSVGIASGAPGVSLSWAAFLIIVFFGQKA